jgi:hypothetical protein
MSLPQTSQIVQQEETASARQRFGKHVPAATNTHAAIEELDSKGSDDDVYYSELLARTSRNLLEWTERKVDDCFFQKRLI